MSETPKILSATGEVLPKGLPKITGVHPYGSKILVEIPTAAEVLGTRFTLGKNVEPDGLAPQAYIVELGPSVPADSGLAVGMRVYWTGRGTSVNDPRTVGDRARAMLEISNIIGIIEE